MTDPETLQEAAVAVANAGLSDAFGHVSVRTGANSLLITPPLPLADARQSAPIEVAADARTLPAGVPLEGWLHLALYDARDDVGAVVRAQPPAVGAFSALGIDLPILGGHAAMLHGVHRHPSSLLVRDRDTADAIAASAGACGAIILRGNGAVTVGADLPQAVARMWVLERAARLALDVLPAGRPEPLPDAEAEWWSGRAGELLPRIFRYLTR